jgi:mono/diheme cytochrome c family protein
MNPILPAQQRENPEPHENTRPVPWAVLFTVALTVAFGIVYIATSPPDLPAVFGDGRTAEELAGPGPAAAGRADGAALYASLCVACHQANGQGLPGVFPPLAGSEWVNGTPSVLAAIVLQGVNGPLTVKGQAYSGSMPGFKAKLADEELAAVLSHVRGQWGNASPAIAPGTVAQVRTRLADAAAPFDGEKALAPLAGEGAAR